MIAKMRLSMFLRLILTLVAMLVLLGSTARAQVGSAEAPTGRGAGQGQAGVSASADAQPQAPSAYLQATGSALRAENTADVEASVDNLRYGCLFASGGQAASFFSTPIFPPPGATLTMLRAYVHDTSAADSVVGVSVLDKYGYLFATWSGNSQGSSGDYTIEIAIPNHVVDYASYSYQVWWQPNQLGSNMMICGFRLYYLPLGGFVHLPAVMKGP
jgi:hypothetical protein